MKKLLFSTILIASAMMVYGQGTKVNTAYAEYNNAAEELAKGELEKAQANLIEAAENIDLAVAHDKTSAKSKTWRYRGNIYTMISGIESMNDGYPNAIHIAMDSYSKALELDTKGSFKNEVNLQLSILHDAEFVNGNESFGIEDYEGAIAHYKNGISIFEILDLVDSVAYYNSALAADNGMLIDVAVENYLACARLGYQDIYCFNRSIIILKDKERYEEALVVSKEARKAHPDDKDLITSQLNVYLASGMFEEAEIEMQQAAEDKPEDPTMWFALGVVKDNLGKMEEAEAAYLKSLEQDPNYFNSNMNLAILYFSQASKMIETANDIPAKEFDRYNVAVKKAKDVLKTAIPYFESAYASNPDRAILMDLKEAYGQLGDNENYKRVKALLENE